MEKPPYQETKVVPPERVGYKERLTVRRISGGSRMGLADRTYMRRHLKATIQLMFGDLRSP
jgi:hypothetical protein